jgi:hypothetical protein
MNNLGFDLSRVLGKEKRIEIYWVKETNDDGCGVCCYVHRKSRKINKVIVASEDQNVYTSYKKFKEDKYIKRLKEDKYIQRLNRQNKLRSIISKINS